MGLLDAGTETLPWQEVKQIAEFIRHHGVIQFLALYKRFGNYENPSLKWGEEMEYHIVEIDQESKTARIYIKAHELIPILNKAEESIQGSFQWNPEYGSWVIESIPSEPYNDSASGLLSVENKLILRRKKLRAILSSINPNIYPVSLPVFPRLGVQNYFSPVEDPEVHNEKTSSIYLDDRIICPHPRFPQITRSIIERKQRPHEIYAPLYKDERTVCADEPREDSIFMDTCGFGMGMSCVQVTLNAKSLLEARCLYDQLVPFTSIISALAACSPFIKGKLTRTDTRWNVLSQAMDDRTQEELDSGTVRPRFGGISSYLCPSPQSQCLNDVEFTVHEATYETLREAGLDEMISRHFAWIFSRDPLVVFKDRIELDDLTQTAHFENFQSTNWNTVRFKPPPSHTSNVGWRVEFRPLDVQITDFENAALCVLVILISRMIVALELNFRIPISLVDENLRRSEELDSALNQKFWFRKNYVPPDCELICEGNRCASDNCQGIFVEVSLQEIFLGTEVFQGLLEIMRNYLRIVVNCSNDKMTEFERYFEFIRRRVTGEIPTGARFLRNFVLNHPMYEKDSVLGEEIAFDIVKMCAENEWIEELLGSRL